MITPDLKHYDFNFPKELIAQKPSTPRDSAKLLVYKRANQKTSFDTFFNLPKYLPKNSVLVFNQTKVIPARLPLYKESGGKVEVLYLGLSNGYLTVLANKPLKVGTKLFSSFSHGRLPGRQAGDKRIIFHISKKDQNKYILKPSLPLSKIDSILNEHGLTPLPPYMKNSPLTEKQRRDAYQTIFAKTGESVAAPTASLHFTTRLITKLKKQGIVVKFVRLDVNLGTFAKLTEDQIKNGKLHKENYFIDKSTAEFIIKAKKQGRPIIAVGTTVVRTLESAAVGKESGSFSVRLLTSSRQSSTDLFIRPGFEFKIVDGLITNFHVPESSLLMLVSALTGRQELLKLYDIAIQRKFKLFSFGDGMLVL